MGSKWALESVSFMVVVEKDRCSVTGTQAGSGIDVTLHHCLFKFCHGISKSLRMIVGEHLLASTDRHRNFSFFSLALSDDHNVEKDWSKRLLSTFVSYFGWFSISTYELRLFQRQRLGLRRRAATIRREMNRPTISSRAHRWTRYTGSLGIERESGHPIPRTLLSFSLAFASDASGQREQVAPLLGVQTADWYQRHRQAITADTEKHARAQDNFERFTCVYLWLFS